MNYKSGYLFKCKKRPLNLCGTYFCLIYQWEHYIRHVLSASGSCFIVNFICISKWTEHRIKIWTRTIRNGQWRDSLTIRTPAWLIKGKNFHHFHYSLAIVLAIPHLSLKFSRQEPSEKFAISRKMNLSLRLHSIPTFSIFFIVVFTILFFLS